MGCSTQASMVTALNNSAKTPLVFEEDNNLPIASMQLVFQMSGSIEDGNKAGLARVVAKMMGEGTKQKGSAAFALELESQAIHLSAHAGTETFVFEVSSLKSEFSKAVSALKELLENPNFDKEVLEKVKTSIVGSLMQSENNFDSVASKALRSVLFEGSVLEAPGSGTVESVQSITLDDVKAFYKAHIISNNAIGVVGGDLTLKEAESILESVVAVLPHGEAKKMLSVPVRTTPLSKTITKETQQAYIYFGSPFFITAESEEMYKARVAMFILGAGGFGTRLMEEIRVKRGLAYSAYAKLSANRSHIYMSGHLQTKLESAEEATKIVKSEIERFVKEGVTQEELDAARRFLLGSDPLRTETLSQRLSRTFLDFYKGLALDNSLQELKKIETLTLDELNSFITKHNELQQLSVVTVTK